MPPFSLTFPAIKKPVANYGDYITVKHEAWQDQSIMANYIYGAGQPPVTLKS
jgi:hypothetical protein